MLLVGPLIIHLDGASVCWSCNHSLDPASVFFYSSNSFTKSFKSSTWNTSVNSVDVLHKTGEEHLFWTAHCDDSMIFVHRVLLVRIFEQASINQRCKGYCGKTLKICIYHSRLRKLFFHKYITFVELKTLVIESPVNSLSLIEPHRSTTFSSPT